MTRGYNISEIRTRLIKLLETTAGLSGVEIATKLGIHRITMVKYLGLFAAEGTIRRNDIGNVTLWLPAVGIINFTFPSDYSIAHTMFQKALFEHSLEKTRGIIKSCTYSDTNVLQIINEVILPCVQTIQTMSQDGKVGYSEETFFINMIIDSIKTAEQRSNSIDYTKNILLLSIDTSGLILAETASVVLRSKGWNTFFIGDISPELMLDLDLRKLLSKLWIERKGTMVVSGFSSSLDGMQFLNDIVNSTRTGIWRNVKFTLCGLNEPKLKADLVTEQLKDLMQWLDTISINNE